MYSHDWGTVFRRYTVRLMPGILPGISSVLFELLVLLVGQFQPHPAAADLDRVIERLAGFKIEIASATRRELTKLLCVPQFHLAGQGSLKILFEELTEPGFAQHEAHIHAMTAALVAALLTRRVGWGQGPAADAADFSGKSLPYRRGALATHVRDSSASFAVYSPQTFLFNG